MKHSGQVMVGSVNPLRPSDAQQMHLLQPLEDSTPSSSFQRSEKYISTNWTGERNRSITSSSLQFFGGILFDDLKSSPI